MARRMLTAIACAAWLIATHPLPAQDVKYEKYQLPNGLTVILHEDHRLPVATINLWYYVGSKDEVTGRSGFAPPVRAPDVHGHRARPRRRL